LHDPDVACGCNAVRLFFEIGDGAAIDQNAHVLSDVALIIQYIGAESGVLREGLIEDLANGYARRIHCGAIHMAAQVGCEVDLGHATRLSRGMELAIRYEVIMKRRSIILAVFGWPVAAAAHSFKLGNINIGHAWGLPSQQTDAQVFMPILNTGTKAESLVGARSDAASLVELRQNNRYDDPALVEFVLEPGQPFAMRPTAKHLRLVGLAKPLVKGDHIKITLDFLNAGEIEIEVHIQDKPGE
jgi:periplasmic copper chaperone A